MLADAGIRVVCDLRSGVEREQLTFTWPGTATPDVLVRDCEPTGGVADLGRVIDGIERGTDGGVRQHMLDQYHALPAVLSPIMRAFVDALLAGGVPALLHCAAGKDRTGFASAMLLSALGSPRSVIEAEYLRSNDHVNAARIRSIVEAHTGRRIAWRTAAGMTCRPEYLEAAMTAAAHAHGSLDGYLEEELGLTPARRQELQRLLLEAGA